MNNGKMIFPQKAYAPPPYTKKFSFRSNLTVAVPYEVLPAHLGAHVPLRGFFSLWRVSIHDFPSLIVERGK
jgi:hypothetical protein